MTDPGTPGRLSRRRVLAASGVITAATLVPRTAAAQAPPASNAQLGSPASTITNPPRDWTPGHPSIYPDPDVIIVDPAFNSVRLGNAPIRRLWTGANWAEGPAWSSQGQYLVLSDVTGNVQYRYIWETGGSHRFENPPTIPTAILSTIRGGSCPVRISSGAWFAGSMMAR